MTGSIVLKSLSVVVATLVVAWGLLICWPSLAHPLDEVAEKLFWAVPFVLATSLATFNNTLRIFDRMEKVIEDDLADLSAEQRHRLTKTVESTEELTSQLLINALIAIAAGLLFFSIGGLQAITQPQWYPDWWVRLRPDLAAVAFRLGLGVLCATVLVIQFMAIPPLVSFYRFFTVDRHLHGTLREESPEMLESKDDGC